MGKRRSTRSVLVVLILWVFIVTLSAEVASSTRVSSRTPSAVARLRDSLGAPWFLYLYGAVTALLGFWHVSAVLRQTRTDVVRLSGPCVRPAVSGLTGLAAVIAGAALAARVPDRQTMFISLMLAALSYAVVWHPTPMTRRVLRAATGVALTSWVVVTAIIVAPWQSRPSLKISTLGRLIDVEYHFGYLVSPGLIDGVSALRSTYAEASTALRLLALLTGLESFEESFRLVAFGQGLAVLLTLILVVRVLDRWDHSIMFLGISLGSAFLVTFSPLNPTLLYPNFSPVRYLWSICMLIVAHSAFANRIVTTRWMLLGILGFVAGPPGVVILLGAILARLQAIVLARRNALIAHLLRELVVAVSVFILATWAVRMVLTDGSVTSGMFVRQALTSGMSHVPDRIPFIGIVVLVSAGVLLTLSASLGSRPREMQWASLCGSVGLSWGVYFVNRPVLQGIFFMQYVVMAGLLSFAVRGRTDSASNTLIARGLLAVIASAGLVSGLGAIGLRLSEPPQGRVSAAAVSGDVELQIFGCGASTSLLQGLCLSDEIAAVARESLDELEAHLQSGRISSQAVVVGAQKFSIEAAGFNRKGDYNRFFVSGINSLATADQLRQHLIREGHVPVVVQARASAFAQQDGGADTAYVVVEEMLRRHGYGVANRGKHWVVFVFART